MQSLVLPGFGKCVLGGGLISDKPCLFSGVEIACIITESSGTSTNPNVFKTLTAAAPSSGPNFNKLVLTGTAVAQRWCSQLCEYFHTTLCEHSYAGYLFR